MRDQKVMRAGMRNKEFILCGLNRLLDFIQLHIQTVKLCSNSYTVEALAFKLCKEFTHFLQALKVERCISNICRSILRT